MPRPKQLIPALVGLPEHLVRCELETDGRRLLEVINDPQSGQVLAHNATVCRHGESDQCPIFKEALLWKKNLLFVIPDVDQHEAPSKRLNGYTPKRSLEAQFWVGPYEISGNVLVHRTDRATIELWQTAGMFFPVPDPVIHHTNQRDIEAGVALVNKHHVAMSYLSEDVAASEELAAGIRELLN